MTWPRLNLALAALAFLVFLLGLKAGDLRMIIPGAVMAAVFGLLWIGIPGLGRKKKAAEQAKRSKPQAGPKPGRKHVGPFSKGQGRGGGGRKSGPQDRRREAKRPPNSRARPKREPRW